MPDGHGGGHGGGGHGGGGHGKGGEHGEFFETVFAIPTLLRRVFKPEDFFKFTRDLGMIFFNFVSGPVRRGKAGKGGGGHGGGGHGGHGGGHN